MKKILSALFLLLLFSGCTEKKSHVFINNVGLCQAPIAMLHIGDIAIENSSRTFNISSEEIRVALVESLRETNCFSILSASNGDSDNEYLVNVKVNLSQQKEMVEKNIFKKEEKERLVMSMSLSAKNNGNSVFANSKSELLIDKSKILGFKNKADAQGDSRVVLHNATKKVSIALRNGFSKL